MTLHGLSPDQTNACASGLRPYFFTKYGLTGPMILDDSASGGSFCFKSRRGGFERVGMPRLFPDVHQVHARAVAVVNRRDLAGEDATP